MAYSEKFLKILAHKDLNITELSNKAGIPHETIMSNVETDFKNATIENVMKIAKALNVEVGDFIPDLQTKKPDRQFTKKMNALQNENNELKSKYEKLLQEVTSVVWKNL